MGLPAPRFSENGDGTVTDHLTGLIWLGNASCAKKAKWIDALAWANTLEDGDCGLSDGSAPGDWRLPNVRELSSLVDYGRTKPALSDGYGTCFSGVNDKDNYWSSTTNSEKKGDEAFYINFGVGELSAKKKSGKYFAWPVRGGK